MFFDILSEFHSESYPQKTNILCYNCCHKFTSQPISMPFLFSNNMFFVKYVFCSWECMKRYNLDCNNSNMNVVFSLIQKFYQHVNGKTDLITIAPPKFVLKDFGGKMSIKEFRNHNKEIIYNIIEYPIIVNNPTVQKIDNFSWIKEDSAKDSYQNHTIKQNIENQNQVVLHRPVGSKSKSSLENSMGLLRV